MPFGPSSIFFSLEDKWLLQFTCEDVHSRIEYNTKKFKQLKYLIIWK